MSVVELRSSRKQKRQATRQGHVVEPKGLYIKHIQPLTHNQTKTFESFSKDKNLLFLNYQICNSSYFYQNLVFIFFYHL